MNTHSTRKTTTARATEIDWAAIDAAHGSLMNHPSDRKLAKLLPHVSEGDRRWAAVKARLRAREASPTREADEVGRAIGVLLRQSPELRERMAVMLVVEQPRPAEDAAAVASRVAMALLDGLGALDAEIQRKSA